MLLHTSCTWICVMLPERASPWLRGEALLWSTCWPVRRRLPWGEALPTFVQFGGYTASGNLTEKQLWKTSRLNIKMGQNKQFQAAQGVSQCQMGWGWALVRNGRTEGTQECAPTLLVVKVQLAFGWAVPYLRLWWFDNTNPQSHPAIAWVTSYPFSGDK